MNMFGVPKYIVNNLPCRKGYISVEELVREISHNKSGLFQPVSSFL
jgi:hypothetical protein